MERLTDREKDIAKPFGRKWAGRANTHIRREGEAFRNQVKVKSEAPGIVHTRIKRPPNGTPLVGGKAEEIMQNMTEGDTYDRLRVEQGAGNGGVKVTPPRSSNQTQSVSELAKDLTANTAVINGGFFQHIPFNPDYGRPVGPTKDRTDFLPIQEAYQGDYRALDVGGEVGISSGPILKPSKENFEDARFQYENKDRPRYNQPGSLTHADNKNPRAAISIFPPKKGVPGDVIMHTLTTADGPRGIRGATMREWQDITTKGSYQYKPDKKGEGKIKERKKQPSTLNLDGGMSVEMGITRGNEHTDRIASGQDPSPVANIIFAGGNQQNEGKEISIKGKKLSESCNIM